MGGSGSGRGRKGSTLSESHKKRIAESARKNQAEKKRKKQEEYRGRQQFVALFNSTNDTTDNNNFVASSDSEPAPAPAPVPAPDRSLNDAPLQEESVGDNLAATVADPTPIVANLDAPEDGDPDQDNEDDDDDTDNTVGIMRTYIKEIQNRIKYEHSKEITISEPKWLSEYLERSVGGFVQSTADISAMSSSLKLQLKKMKMHTSGIYMMLYPNWVNASDYKNTAESFGTVALHNEELAAAVKELNLGNEVKLTSDMKYLCDVMGTDLPFLPISSESEMTLFGKLFLKGFMDENSMALEWIKHVDGVKIFPKLPVHLRNYRQRFDRNRRVEDAYKEAKPRRDLLSELNDKLLPFPADPNKKDTNEDSAVAQDARAPVPNCQPAPYLSAWGPILAQQPMDAPIDSARSGTPQVEVGGTSIYQWPEVTVYDPFVRRNKGQRGRDARKRRRRRCGRCKGKVGDEEAMACDGSSKQEFCKRFDIDRNQIN